MATGVVDDDVDDNDDYDNNDDDNDDNDDFNDGGVNGGGRQKKRKGHGCTWPGGRGGVDEKGVNGGGGGQTKRSRLHPARGEKEKGVQKYKVTRGKGGAPRG